ncbi:hypothetical protein AMJ74_01380 [candidate division WOR_3 bacterium SM1_77]|jgi:hypothetical protein|uniref:Uncharacterized protein n=1 Tax=candidate division WOR_3 bacterium SM1_77 TaxID=1703778 RepID=A0A0S8K065_UNCW3|nr:MAG: hypothetical protein AMJ74_01380 [candidate division WOR_3 bacterium SM1_77]
MSRLRKPAIPAVVVPDRRLSTLLGPMKQNIEMLTGVRGGKLEYLSDTATVDEAVAKINEIIDRLNN